MRVLLIADGLEGSSLSETGLWLHEIAAGLVARGHEVLVVCRGTLEPWQEPEDPPGVTVWRPGDDGFEMALGEALAHEPDIVHLASPGPLGARVVEILRDLPVVLDVHDFWPICPNSDLLRRPRMDPCGEHHPFRGCGPCAGLSRLRTMEERIEIAAGARLILAHSAFTRVRLNAGLGRLIETVDYGVDVSRFRPDPDPPGDPEIASLFETRGQPRILFLGPPTPARGCGKVLDILVGVRSRLPEIEIVVAGRDPQNPDWHHVFLAESREMGLSGNTRALPRVAPADLPALLASCAVGMAPVLSNEPGGLFLLQAMAAGLPLVASPLGAVQDLMRQGDEGLLVDAHEVPAFANALCAILVDPMARVAFSEAARHAAAERHDREHTLFALEQMYYRLFEMPRARAAA